MKDLGQNRTIDPAEMRGSPTPRPERGLYLPLISSAAATGIGTMLAMNMLVEPALIRALPDWHRALCCAGIGASFAFGVYAFGAWIQELLTDTAPDPDATRQDGRGEG